MGRRFMDLDSMMAENFVVSRDGNSIVMRDPDVVETLMELRSSWFEKDGWVDHRLTKGCGDSRFSFDKEIIEYMKTKSLTLTRYEIENVLKST